MRRPLRPGALPKRARAPPPTRASLSPREPRSPAHRRAPSRIARDVAGKGGRAWLRRAAWWCAKMPAGRPAPREPLGGSRAQRPWRLRRNCVRAGRAGAARYAAGPRASVRARVCPRARRAPFPQSQPAPRGWLHAVGRGAVARGPMVARARSCSRAPPVGVSPGLTGSIDSHPSPSLPLAAPPARRLAQTRQRKGIPERASEAYDGAPPPLPHVSRLPRAHLPPVLVPRARAPWPVPQANRARSRRRRDRSRRNGRRGGGGVG